VARSSQAVILVALALHGGCIVKGMGGTTMGGGGVDASGNATVPAVVGMTQARAEEAYANAGFTGDVRTDTLLCDSVMDGKVIEIGTVCAQQPVAGVRQNGRLAMSITERVNEFETPSRVI
jgi:hypothetical protein